MLPLNIQFVQRLIILLGNRFTGGRGLFDGRIPPFKILFQFDQLLANFLDVAQSRFFRLPLLAQTGPFAPQLLHFLFDFRKFFLSVTFALFRQLALRKLQLRKPPLDLINFVRNAFQLHCQATGRLIDKIDRLVRKETIRNVTIGQLRRGDQRRVLNLDPFMMRFITRLETAKNSDGILDRRLSDKNRLESPFEGCIFFDVFSILIECCRTDATQIPACQRGLEKICRVIATFCGTCSHNGMQFINEKNDAARCIFNLAEDRLQTLFKFAPKFCTCNQGSHIECDDPLILQTLWHIRLDNPNRQPFGNGRLANARLTDQDRVVFGAARKNLDHPPDLLIPANHRIKLVLASALHQIDAIALQRLEFFLGILVGHPRATAYRLQGF